MPLNEPGVGPLETCSDPLAAGACQLTSCNFGGIGSPSGGYGDFGPITASVGATAVPLDYSGFGYPTVYFPAPVTLGTGDAMVFHGGDGARVPKFDVAAIIPGPAVITSPVPATDGGSVILDASQDLTVTWLPISIGQVHFVLRGGSLSARVTISLACTFDGSPGSGVVSKTLLSALKEMSGADPTYTEVKSALEATSVVGGLTIVTQSSQYSPTNAHGVNVTLQ